MREMQDGSENAAPAADCGNQADGARALSPWLTAGTLFGMLVLHTVTVFAAMVAFGVAAGLLEIGGAAGNNWLDAAGGAVCIMLWTPLAVGMLWLLLRLSGRKFRDYLALRPPGPKDAVKAVLGLAALLGAFEAFYFCLGVSPLTEWQLRVFGAVKGFWLWLLITATVLAAPLWEEILFRGFLYRGWARGRCPFIGGVIIPAALWALIHGGQYDWFFLAQIFVFGVYLGAVRRRTGSLWLCAGLHALNNAAAVFFTLTALARG